MTRVILYIVALKSAYSTDRSLYGHVVCCVPVFCSLLAILYMYLSNCLEKMHTLKRLQDGEYTMIESYNCMDSNIPSQKTVVHADKPST